MRRLEAAVGIGASLLARERDLVARIAEQLGAPRAELPEKIAGLLDRLKAADRENARLKQQATTARAAELVGGAVDVDAAFRSSPPPPRAQRMRPGPWPPPSVTACPPALGAVGRSVQEPAWSSSR